jgi:cell division protease FtsH
MRAAARRRVATAYHEAGHAVAMYWLSLPIASATIIPDKEAGSAGAAHGARFHPTPDRLEKEIIIMLAGPHAQRKHTGRSDHRGATQDYRRAVKFAFRRFGERRELGDVEEELRSVVGAYLRYLDLWTARNVSLWWPAIEAVAAALLKRETLSGRQIRGILREAGWRQLARGAGVTGT